VLEPNKRPVLHRDVDVLVIVISGIEADNHVLTNAREFAQRAQDEHKPIVIVCTDARVARAQLASLFGVNILATVVSDNTGAMLDQLATWFAETRSDLKLAFAANFSWMRRHIAKEAINNTAVQNGAIGLVMIIPGADLPVMTLNQAKMVLQIAAAYGQHLNKDRIKELAAVVGGGFALRAAARTAIGFVPVLGWAIRGVIGYSGTMAMGYAALEYFDKGGTPEGLAVKLKEVRDDLVETAQKGTEALPIDEVKTRMKALPAAISSRKRSVEDDAEQIEADLEKALKKQEAKLDRVERRGKLRERLSRDRTQKETQPSGYHKLA